MSHTAFRPVTVVDLSKAKYKVACFDSWGDKLVVGGNDGSLRFFEGSPQGGFKEVQCIERFSKVMEQLCVVEHKNKTLLLIIVDGLLRVYALPDLTLVHQVDHSAGCYMFAVNKDVIPRGGGASTGTSTGTATATAFASLTSTASTTAASPKHVPLCLCIALKKKQLMVFHWDDDSKFIHFVDLVVPDTVRAMDWVGASLCVGFKREKYVLIRVLSGSMHEIFPVGRRCITCLLPDKELLLCQDTRGICVDHDGKPTRKESIQWPEVPIAISYHHPYIIALLSSGLEVRNKASHTHILTQNIKFPKGTMVTKKQHIFAASLTSVVYLEPITLIEQVAELVDKAQFKAAVTLVECSQDSQWRDPKDRDAKVKELHTLFSYHQFNTAHYQEAMRYFHLTNCNPRQILSLFPDVLPTTGGQLQHSHPVRVQRIQGESNLLMALSALIPYLANIRSRILLNQAAYNESNTEFAMPLPVLIDTVLLKAYLLTDVNLVMPFLERGEGNKCDIEEAQNVLRIYEKYEELVCLYQSRGMHRSALELLQKLGQDDSHPDNPLHGTGHTVAYLQQSMAGATEETKNDCFALVLEFSRWVLRKDPEDGLLIFTYSHTNQGGGNMPPELALDHLKKSADAQCCIAFLVSLIKVGEASPIFHNELIFMYFEQVKEELEFRKTKGLKKQIIAKAAGENGAEFTTTGVAGREPGRLGILRANLLAFLKSSSEYTPEKMLTAFPTDELLEERAILLSRVGKHAEALTIYAHKIKDPAVAEEYCQRFYHEDTSDEDSTYLRLLQVYLQPSLPNVEPNLAAAVHLLTKHYDKIDSAKALDLLPADVPLATLMPFMSAVLCQNKHTMRNNQVVKQLLSVEHLQVKTVCLKTSRKRIVIDSSSACLRCGKKIGNSAFARAPNGAVIHYICSIAKE